MARSLTTAGVIVTEAAQIVDIKQILSNERSPRVY